MDGSIGWDVHRAVCKVAIAEGVAPAPPGAWPRIRSTSSPRRGASRRTSRVMLVTTGYSLAITGIIARRWPRSCAELRAYAGKLARQVIRAPAR